MRTIYLILNILYSNGAKSKLYALSQKDIIEALEADGEKWSERTIYNKIRELSKNGYILDGLRQGNAKTFYISNAGINWMKDVEGATENEQE